mgnify:CR=1 FL=1
MTSEQVVVEDADIEEKTLDDAEISDVVTTEEVVVEPTLETKDADESEEEEADEEEAVEETEEEEADECDSAGGGHDIMGLDVAKHGKLGAAKLRYQSYMETSRSISILRFHINLKVPYHRFPS